MKELESYKVIPRPRKGGVLTPSTFGCLEGIPALNVTKGCMFQCIYCYARGYSQAPQKGEIFLYANLPDILRKEVLRRKIVPQWVILNPNAIKRQNRLACLRVAASTKAGWGHCKSLVAEPFGYQALRPTDFAGVHLW